jgi:Tfp pilus assembly protein PilX
MRTPIHQRGQLLVAGIVLIVVIALMVVTLGFLYVSSERSSTLHNQSDASYFIARSGLESAIYQFSQSPPAVWCTGLVAAGNTNQQVGAGGAGSFTITSATVYPIAPVSSTLSGAGITTTTPGVITVTVTAGAFSSYAPHGRIRIENEEIDYSSTSTSAAVCGTAPCFISWRRGANGTTAATHAVGAVTGAVFQDDQCVIQSRGCAQVPAGAAPCPAGVPQRVLEATVK